MKTLEYWRKNNKLYPNVSKLVQVSTAGGNRVRLRLENLEMSLFLKYNLRALSYAMDNLESVLSNLRYSNSGTRDHGDLDDKLGVESILVDSDNEDSDIDLDFIYGSEDEDE